MKAVVWYGPHVIRLEERPLAEPGSGQVLIRPRYAGICGSDKKLYEYGVLGTHRPSQPFIMGHEAAGTVAAVGPGVEGLSTGDTVAVNPLLGCGQCFYCQRGEENLCERLTFRSITADGVFSEFFVLPAEQALRIPAGFDLRLAATIEPLSVGVQAMRRLPVQPSDSVLLIGAGTIGLGILGMLRCAGVPRVMAADLLDHACQQAREMGAAMVVNASREDLPQKAAAFFGPRGPDVVIEAAGAPEAQAEALEFVRPGGSVLLVGITGEALTPVNVNRITRSNLQVLGTVRATGESFRAAAELVISGRVRTAGWISQVFPFEQALQAFECASDPAYQLTKCLLEFPS